MKHVEDFKYKRIFKIRLRRADAADARLPASQHTRRSCTVGNHFTEHK